MHTTTLSAGDAITVAGKTYEIGAIPEGMLDSADDESLFFCHEADAEREPALRANVGDIIRVNDRDGGMHLLRLHRSVGGRIVLHGRVPGVRYT